MIRQTIFSRARLSLAFVASSALAATPTAAWADATPECNVGTGIGSTECGVDASATAAGATAIGNLAQATGDISTATGQSSIAAGPGATAYGSQAVASATAATALGHNSDATALGATAVGVSAQATANFATSVGRIANASGAGATALGSNSIASAANSVALGQNSVANQANTVSVGAAGAERRIVNVAAGTAATDAVNLGQLNAVNASLGADIDTLFDLRRRDRREARRGTAAAVAMSEAPMPSRDGGISYSVHGATYRGQYGLGASLKYRISAGAAVDVGVSHAGHKDTAARIGLSGEF